MSTNSTQEFNPKVDYFSVLSVTPDASIDDIKRSYKETLLRTHPDAQDTTEDLTR